jgi:hypothetical protein
VAPFGLVLPLAASYWLASPEAREARSAAAAFSSWIVQEAEAFARRLPPPH